MTKPAILQFGTGRLLQAHADLMIGEALAEGKALGPVCAVAVSGSPAAARRAAALAAGDGYVVRIRGLLDGEAIDGEVRVTSVVEALDAVADWATVKARASDPAIPVWISNTADRGYELDPADDAATELPRSFPGKLVRLLQARFLASGAPLSVFPLELVTDNGKVLAGIVRDLATSWGADERFLAWLDEQVIFADSLVDRIVSEALDPVGAIAEPYALWVIRAVDGLVLPCEHRDIIVTDDLERYARLKLFILNLGHTWLAHQWLTEKRPADETVREILQDEEMRASLTSLYDEEVLPVFTALGIGTEAAGYRDTVMQRFMNPYLDHAFQFIIENHTAKLERRIGGFLKLAHEVAPLHRSPRLEATLQPLDT